MRSLDPVQLGSIEQFCKAANACRCVDAETLRSFASQDRNASTSLRPKLVG